MRNQLITLVMFGLLAGCSPTWFQDFKDNPVQQTNTVLDSVTSIEEVAIVAFGQLKPFLPADQQSIFQTKFDGSIVTLNLSMNAVRLAVKTAADAQVEHPDLTSVIADVVKAVDAVRSVVTEARDLLKSPKLGDAPGKMGMSAPSLTQDPVGYTEMGDMVDALKK